MEQETEKLPIRPGFYWVRLFGLNWNIAQYAFDVVSGHYVWYMAGHNVPFCTNDFEEVGEEVLPQHYDLQSTAVAEQLGARIFQHYTKDGLFQLISILLFILTFVFQIMIIIKLYK